jgi:hypothetical protein
VEQKNWTHVRKLLGWERYDTLEALKRINQLYEQLRIFQNLFQPSMKLRSKVRQGSRVMRHLRSALYSSKAGTQIPKQNSPTDPGAKIPGAKYRPF